MKRIIKLVFSCIVLGVILFFPLLPFLDVVIFNELDYNTIIPIVMMLFLMFNPVYKSFNLPIIKKSVFLLLFIQIAQVFFRVFIPDLYNSLLFNYYTYLIIFALFLVILNKYFDLNISQEFVILKFKVNKLLKSKKSEDRFKGLLLVFEWIIKNKNQPLKTKEKSFYLIKKCIDSLVFETFSLTSNNNSNFDKLYKVIKDVYKIDKNNQTFVEKYFELLSTLIRKYNSCGNIELSNEFIDLLTEDIFQFELIRTDEEHQISFIRSFFKLISQEKDKEILKKYLDNIRIEFLKFNFRINTLSFILIIQELVEIVIDNKNIVDTEFMSEYKNFLVSQLIQKKDSENIYIFRNSMLNRILKDSESFDEFFDILLTILYSSGEIWSQNRGLIFIVNKFIDDRLDIEEMKTNQYGKLFELKTRILSRTEDGLLGYMDIEKQIEYLIYLNKNKKEQEKEFILSRVTRIINSNRKFQDYFISKLEEYTNEDNFDDSFNLFYEVVRSIYDPTSISDHTSFLSIIDYYVKTYIKLKSINPKYKLSIDGQSDLKDILNIIKNSFSEEFTGKLIDMIGDYLGNPIIGKEIFKFIFDEALTNIETNRGDIVKIASNRFGWYFYKSIDVICETNIDQNNISRIIDKLIEFYKFVNKHLKSDIVLFVGTLFIVNGIYFERMLEIYPNNKTLRLIYTQSFMKKLNDLDAILKSKLIESYNIRKYSIEKYITGVNDDKIIKYSKQFLNRLESSQ